MPKRYKANLKLAQIICKKVKERVVSSNDVIPRAKLPFFYLDEAPFYIKQFGKQRISEYLNHTKASSHIRHRAIELARGLKMSPKFVSSLVSASFGLGECEEATNFATSLLLLEHQTDFVLMVIVGIPKGSREPYFHALLLIGDSKNIKLGKLSLAEFFSRLSPDVVVLDPFLDHCGPANTYLNDQDAYLRHYNFQTIAGITHFSANEASIIRKLQNDSQKIVTQMKREGFKPYKNPKRQPRTPTYLIYHHGNSQKQGRDISKALDKRSYIPQTSIDKAMFETTKPSLLLDNSTVSPLSFFSDKTVELLLACDDIPTFKPTPITKNSG